MTRQDTTMNRTLRPVLRVSFATLLALVTHVYGLGAQGGPPEAASETPPGTTTLLPHPEESRWWVSGQLNLIGQAHGSFPARYSGPNSFKSTSEQTLSRVITVYTGLRLGRYLVEAELIQ